MVAEEPRLIIKFEGRDADRHTVDMRLLGRSLMGFDRIISDGVILLSERRLPKHGERAKLIVKAKEPQAGSTEIIAFVQERTELLLLGWKLFSDSGGEIVWDWVSFVLEYYVGHKSKADKHLDAIMETQRLHLAARDASEARFVEELGAARRDAMALVEKLAVPAIHATAPVGPSTRSVSFATQRSLPTVVDEPMADAIRARGELEVGDLQAMVLTADGWVYHIRVLNVHHPELPGRFLSAKVRDPIAEQEGNAYAAAALEKATIRVQAKPAYRAGQLEAIYIMDYEGRYDDAA